jgi:NAD(P) transhydrogenase subunit alpha
MMMTAAGTISAAKAFVMGVGVAGLQAIATARRLGAQVSATDVRSATKEQIQSLGAKPIFVESVAGIEGEGSGGYATEMSEEYQKAQAELVSGHIAKQDIVITTALIPGRAAPRLISDAQIATMKPGSVIFDLAVSQGGNVEGSVADQVVERHGVKIVGWPTRPRGCPPMLRRCFRATCSISSRPSGTRRRAPGAGRGNRRGHPPHARRSGGASPPAGLKKRGRGRWILSRSCRFS